jgi:hypothetical protein
MPLIAKKAKKIYFTSEREREKYIYICRIINKEKKCERDKREMCDSKQTDDTNK